MRGSGVIRQLADVIILAYRPEGDSRRNNGEDELIVAKQRDRATGPIDIWFNTETVQYEEGRGA